MTLTPKQDETFNDLASALHQLSRGSDGLTRDQMMKLAEGAYGGLMALWAELPKSRECSEDFTDIPSLF